MSPLTAPAAEHTADAPTRRRVAGHVCTACQRPWALTGHLQGPVGLLVVCRHCGAVAGALPRPDVDVSAS